MIVKRGNSDYSKSYRPCRISEVYGQEEIKEIIKTGFERQLLPHTLLFHGFSGFGKTTFARIIAI